MVNVVAQVIYWGWPLGSSESVACVICLGFAVDYVVHLAAHFVHSKQKSRFHRIRESLRDLGISIASGALTTILACLPLFICLILIFSKFAIFVIATIIFSTLYSLFFFAAMLHIIGPSGRCGDIIYMWESLKNLILVYVCG